MIVALHVPTPITTPVDEFTDAMVASLVLHVPPLSPLLVKVACEPIHTVEAPLTVPAFGRGFTVIICDALGEPQLLVNV